MRKLQLLTIITVVLTITACGLHLRSQNQLPAKLHIVYLHSINPYGSFESTFRQTLRSAGVRVVKSREQAPVSINIIRAKFTHTVPALGGSTLARTYTFNAVVIYDLTNNKGKLLLPQQTVTSSRSLTLNANQLLESNDQAALLQREMTRELINKLFNRLSSDQTLQALEKPKKK